MLVVAVNSDASVRALKGSSRPVIPQADRAAMLAALECVDCVTVFGEPTPLSLAQAIRPDVLVKGQDYASREVVGAECAGRVHLVPMLPGHSTTAMLARISS